MVFIWGSPGVSKLAEQVAEDFQSIPDIKQVTSLPFLLLSVCHVILKAEILLSRSQSKPFGARAVSICLSIQVLAQQVPVFVTACKCYYRIPGNNGQKG